MNRTPEFIKQIIKCYTFQFKIQMSFFKTSINHGVRAKPVQVYISAETLRTFSFSTLEINNDILESNLRVSPNSVEINPENKKDTLGRAKTTNYNR